jgi:hypothetical protein
VGIVLLTSSFQDNAKSHGVLAQGREDSHYARYLQSEKTDKYILDSKNSSITKILFSDAFYPHSVDRYFRFLSTLNPTEDAYHSSLDRYSLIQRIVYLSHRTSCDTLFSSFDVYKYRYYNDRLLFSRNDTLSLYLPSSSIPYKARAPTNTAPIKLIPTWN